MNRVCRQRTRRALGALVLGLVAACQGMSEPPAVVPVSAEKSLIRFEDPDYEFGFYSMERDSRSGSEYHVARLLGVESQAILAAYKTSPSYVLRERATEGYIASLWDDEELVWGDKGRTMSGVGPTPYRLFRVVGRPIDCVGFSQHVGDTSDDLGRKSDLVFGYFCREDPRAMTTEAAEELIGKVSVTHHR
jgi:hypothetical protein